MRYSHTFQPLYKIYDYLLIKHARWQSRSFHPPDYIGLPSILDFYCYYNLEREKSKETYQYMIKHMPIVLNEKCREEIDLTSHFVEGALFILNLLEKDLIDNNISIYYLMHWGKNGEKSFFRKISAQDFLHKKHDFYLCSYQYTNIYYCRPNNIFFSNNILDVMTTKLTDEN